jgi:hypothetical protein
MSDPHDSTQSLTATAAPSVEEPTPEQNKPFDADQIAFFLAMVEALVHSTSSKIPNGETAEGQLKALREISHLLSSQQSTRAQFMWNVFLQTFGLGFAVMFGVFAALAYNMGNIANVQSSIANQLTFLSLCLSSNSVSHALYFHKSKSNY